MTVNQSEPVNDTGAAPGTQQLQVETPGALIRRAREEAGLTRKELSSRICLIGDKLVHLENDDFARLPAALYVKGYIRNICKELKIDETPLLQAYSGYCADEEESPAILDHVQRDSGSIGGGRRRLPGLALVPLIAVAGVFWWINGKDLTPPAIVSSERPEAVFVGDDAGLPADEAGTEVAGAEGEVAVTGPSSDTAGPGEQAVAIAEGAPAQEAPDGVEATARVAAVSAAAEEPVAQEVEAVSADRAIGAALQQETTAAPAGSQAQPDPRPEPAESPALAAAQVPAMEAAAAAAAEAAAAEARLHLSFAEEAWIEVKDASGSVLLAKLQPAGSGVDLRGEPPFKLMLGNAAATEVRYEGELVDSSPQGGRRTRRITVGD